MIQSDLHQDSVISISKWELSFKTLLYFWCTIIPRFHKYVTKNIHEAALKAKAHVATMVGVSYPKPKCQLKW